MSFIASFKTRFVFWVWNHTPTCVEMARLTSQTLEKKCSLRMRLKMRLHFVICAWCRRYFKQVNFLHEHAARVEMLPEGMPERVLSFEAKSRMKAEVRKNLATVM